MKSLLKVYLFVGLLLCACNDAQQESVSSADVQQEQPSKTITSDMIEGLSYDDFALSTEGQRLTESWKKYNELAIQVSYLKTADFSFFESEKSTLLEFLDQLKKSIPENLNTPAVISRVVVLETMVLKLKENLKLNIADQQTQLNHIKDVMVAFSNLNWQINKKLEKDKYSKIQPEK